MAHATLPDGAVRIRRLYPTVRPAVALWAQIKALTAPGDPAGYREALGLARAYARAHPRAAAAHQAARAGQGARRAFLAAQQAQEREVRALFEALAAEAAGILAKAELKGKLAPGRLPATLAGLRGAVRAAYGALGRLLRAQVKGAAARGLRGAMTKAEAAQGALRGAREGAAPTRGPLGDPLGTQKGPLSVPDRTPTAPRTVPEGARGGLSTGYGLAAALAKLGLRAGSDGKRGVFFNLSEGDRKGTQKGPQRVEKGSLPYRTVVKEEKTCPEPSEGGVEHGHGTREADARRQILRYAVKGGVFQRLFKGALKRTMAAGLFGETGVSPRVWDLQAETEVRLRRLVAAAIARGASAAEASRDIRGLLVQPDTLRGDARAEARPGPGVYRSAYKNALRLTRTETNRAFVLADVSFARKKGWLLQWMVSSGAREEDECLKAGTMIQTYGGLVAVEKIKPGEIVLTHQLRWRRVTRTFINKIRGGSLMRLRFRGAGNRIHEIFCTPNHPFLIDGRWVPASALKMGDLGTAAPSPHRVHASRIWSDGSDKAGLGFARNWTAPRQRSIGEGPHGASLFLFVGKPRRSRKVVGPSAGEPVDGDSGKASCRQNNSGCRVHAEPGTAAYETRPTSQACPDVFCRSSGFDSPASGSIGGSSISARDAYGDIAWRRSGKPGSRAAAPPARTWTSNSAAAQTSPPQRTPRNGRKGCGRDSFLLRPSTSSSKKSYACAESYVLHELPRGKARSARSKLDISYSSIHCAIPCGQIPQCELIGKKIIAVDGGLVYNLAVDEDNSYFANGVAVHNCDDLAGRPPMTPDEFADLYPVHPNDLCWASLVPPEEPEPSEAVGGSE